MNSFFKFLLLFLVLNIVLLTVSCDPTENPIIEKPYSEGIFVINEGTFGGGNASISYINPTTNKVTLDVFNTVNAQPIGDVLQSMSIEYERNFLIVNNSQKIEIVDGATFEKIGTINGLQSPRYLLPISATKAYVTDLYSGGINIIDLNTNTISGKITSPCLTDLNLCWTEQLLKVNNEIFVANMKDGQLIVIDPLTDEITDTIEVGIDPNSMVVDVNNNIWVLCGGGFCPICEPASLYCISSQTHEIVKYFSFNESAGSIYPSSLVINSLKNKLYFINTDIYTISINDTQLPTTPIINANGRSLYGLSYYFNNDLLYLCDAVNFTQAGKVFSYKTNGQAVDTFNVGIVPSKVYFR